MEYCDICNETRIIIDGSPMRKEYNSYIKLALREAILNCFCHRDYNKRSNIKIEYFDNRCEIISPGGFYGGLTIEEALSGVQSFRNKYLVQLLHKLGYIENYSSGLNRIISEYEKYNIIPIIESSLNMFKITFPNINYHLDNITVNELSYYIKDNVADVANKYENVADNVADVANESLEKILIAAIRKNNKISRKDLARLINKSSKTIERLLKNSKRIIRVGSTKSGHWEIIEDEKNE